MFVRDIPKLEASAVFGTEPDAAVAGAGGMVAKNGIGPRVVIEGGTMAGMLAWRGVRGAAEPETEGRR